MAGHQAAAVIGVGALVAAMASVIWSSPHRRARLESHVRLMAGHRGFLAAVTVSALRYGTLIAQWGAPRRQRLEGSIEATTVIPVSDRLLSTIADLRFACRLAGHPLHDRNHTGDLWIAACRSRR